MRNKGLFREFDLKFINLKVGKHTYNFSVGKDFFYQFEDSLVEECQAEITLILDKQSENHFILDFQIEGNFNMDCDRCLNNFSLHFNEQKRMVLKVDAEGKRNFKDEDEIIYVSPYDYQINLATLIYEFISFQLPMKKECSMGGQICSEEMEKFFISSYHSTESSEYPEDQKIIISN